VEAQLAPLFIDLSNDEEANPSLQQMPRRKRKGVAQAASIPFADTEDLIGNKRKREGQEGEIRQGRRTYEIVGSHHAGYALQCQSVRAKAGPLTIPDTEDEGSLGQPLTPKDDTSIGEDIETDTEYMEEKDIKQLARELPNSQTQVEQVQINSEDATGDTTERLHGTTTEEQPTAAQASGMDLEDRNLAKAGNERKLHETGTEESKEEVHPKNIGGKRRRPRRTQLADLLAGAEPPTHGKRSRTAADYTPTLDKEDTKVAAKDIKTLPGSRHQRWPVGYARSTINKVLAPGQDAGYGLFATSSIECNAIICTYEGAPVDYDEAVTDRYRSHYLMTCPITKRAIDAADFNSCYGRFACDPLDKAFTMLFVGLTLNP
jgi:hypothetical protein